MEELFQNIGIFLSSLGFSQCTLALIVATSGLIFGIVKSRRQNKKNREQKEELLKIEKRYKEEENRRDQQDRIRVALESKLQLQKIIEERQEIILNQLYEIIVDRNQRLKTQEIESLIFCVTNTHPKTFSPFSTKDLLKLLQTRVLANIESILNSDEIREYLRQLINGFDPEDDPNGAKKNEVNEKAEETETLDLMKMVRELRDRGISLIKIFGYPKIKAAIKLDYLQKLIDRRAIIVCAPFIAFFLFGFNFTIVFSLGLFLILSFFVQRKQHDIRKDYISNGKIIIIKEVNIGQVKWVNGPVVDVNFGGTDGIPDILNALEITCENGDVLILECQKHLGDGSVRTIAMDSTDDLTIGMKVIDTGKKISLHVDHKTEDRLIYGGVDVSSILETQKTFVSLGVSDVAGQSELSNTYFSEDLDIDLVVDNIFLSKKRLPITVLLEKLDWEIQIVNDEYYKEEFVIVEKVIDWHVSLNCDIDNEASKADWFDNKPEDISAIIRLLLSGSKSESELKEVGYVSDIEDGIARIYGLTQAQAGELVEFENGVQAICLNLEEEYVGVVLLGSSNGIDIGSVVKSTNRIASLNVDEACVGRIVDPLGQPIDGKGPITMMTYEILMEDYSDGDGYIDLKLYFDKVRNHSFKANYRILNDLQSELLRYIFPAMKENRNNTLLIVVENSLCEKQELYHLANQIELCFDISMYKAILKKQFFDYAYSLDEFIDYAKERLHVLGHRRKDSSRIIDRVHKAICLNKTKEGIFALGKYWLSEKNDIDHGNDFICTAHPDTDQKKGIGFGFLSIRKFLINIRIEMKRQHDKEKRREESIELYVNHFCTSANKTVGNSIIIQDDMLHLPQRHHYNGRRGNKFDSLFKDEFSILDGFQSEKARFNIRIKNESRNNALLVVVQNSLEEKQELNHWINQLEMYYDISMSRTILKKQFFDYAYSLDEFIDYAKERLHVLGHHRKEFGGMLDVVYKTVHSNKLNSNTDTFVISNPSDELLKNESVHEKLFLN